MVRARLNAVQDAKQITNSLQRTASTMSTSLSTADTALSTLLQDDDTIKDSLHEHESVLKSELSETSIKLNKVKLAALREKYMVYGALSFFTTCVVYIVVRRTRVLTLVYLLVTGAIHSTEMIKSLYSYTTSTDNNSSIITNLQQVDRMVESLQHTPLVHGKEERRKDALLDSSPPSPVDFNGKEQEGEIGERMEVTIDGSTIPVDHLETAREVERLRVQAAEAERIKLEEKVKQAENLRLEREKEREREREREVEREKERVRLGEEAKETERVLLEQESKEKEKPSLEDLIARSMESL